MKFIRSSSDLAINGASPAFPEPLHVGRPNIGDREHFMARVNEILDRRWLSNNGPMVRAFEEEVAGYLGVKHCVAICNGTIALEIAIRALDLRGEVIVPSYTFVATAHALQWQGITPVFADIDPVTHNLDPEAVRRMISPQTSGVIGVHLWGRPAPIVALQAIADEYGLQLMYDASHAFACSHGGRMIGNFGRCEVFSFHATKFFSTFEGGAVTTNDDALAEKLRLMRNFGFAGFDNVIYPGTNGKMTEIAAAFGLTNLESLDTFVEVNRRHYTAYLEGVSAIPGLSLLQFDETEKNNYQYLILELAPEFPVTRDNLVRIFHAENILVRKYFWPGCHNMMPYRAAHPDAGSALPSTEAVSKRVVVLPTGTAMSAEQVKIVLDILGVIFKS